MKKILLAASLACVTTFGAFAQQKFESKKENIKTRNVNQIFANFPESTDDGLWKITYAEFTLKNLSKFTKDTVLVFKYKVVRKEPSDKIKKGEINTAPKEGMNLEFFLASSTLGDDYDAAVRNNLKKQFEPNKSKLLIPKDPIALKNMIDKIVIW
jgi:hypothetical protein